MFERLLLNPYVLGVGALLLVVSHGYAVRVGYAWADRAAEVAELKAALEVAYQDLDAQRVAAEHSRRAAEENSRAAAHAQERINEYEAELQARGADARCLIGDDDLRWLRESGVGSDHAASPRR
ncbi:MAG TPA: hypothetical protein VEZ16_00065 [Microvirga sp.]|nr:hypothetical protein [Microvirga sp.]